MADEKKYLDSNGLARLLANLVTAFAAKTHTHTVSELGDYTVDTELSATSTNPVTNQAIKSQFDAVDAALDGKSDSGHDHTITAAASDDDIVVLTGTNGTNKVTYSASHAASGATAGSYGDSANQTPAYGATFKVPYVTVNATGHVTGISAHTVKIPAKIGLSDLGITATAAELNIMDGVTATTAELNYVDGVTSGIQGQLDSKAAKSHTHTIANVTGLQDALDALAITAITDDEIDTICGAAITYAESASF